MPDISMCSGEGCPRAPTCYRAQATPDEYRQTYFASPPMKPDQSCEYHWPIAALNKPDETEQTR